MSLVTLARRVIEQATWWRRPDWWPGATLTRPPRWQRSTRRSLTIFSVVRSGRSSMAPFGVAADIDAAYWFTSSTSFANPAVTIARVFSNTFAGIAPGSVRLSSCLSWSRPGSL